MNAELVLAHVDNELSINGVLPVLPKVGYSMKEAQSITGLGKTTLWEAIANGELKCYKVGRRTLFSLKHLEDFMAQYDTASPGGAGEQNAKPSRRRKRKE